MRVENRKEIQEREIDSDMQRKREKKRQRRGKAESEREKIQFMKEVNKLGKKRGNVEVKRNAFKRKV